MHNLLLFFDYQYNSLLFSLRFKFFICFCTLFLSSFSAFLFLISLKELISFLSFYSFSHSVWNSIEVDFSLGLSFPKCIEADTMHAIFIMFHCPCALLCLTPSFTFSLKLSAYFCLIFLSFSLCKSNFIILEIHKIITCIFLHFLVHIFLIFIRLLYGCMR